MTHKTLVILTHVVHDAITLGFVPAAKRLDCYIVILTDQPLEHQQFYATGNDQYLPDQIISCDVFNGLAVIETLLQHNIRPDAVFSNSDHLQTQTSQAAQFFSVPGKDWATCYRCKNKSAMRTHLQHQNLPSAWHHSLQSNTELQHLTVSFPCVVKPQEGVASIDVKLCNDFTELEQFCLHFWHNQPGQKIIIEEYLQGPLFTLETLGDGNNLLVAGGYETQVSAPPYFIELECVWNNDIDSDYMRQAFAQIKAFGIGFGACHSEFVLTEDGPRLVEINYRSIGDGCEFLLDRLAPFNWFETIISLYLGQPLELQEPIQGCALTRFFIADRSGELKRVPENFERHEPHYIRLQNLKASGEQHTLSNSNKDYLAVLSAVGDNKASLMENVNTISSQLIWEIA